MGNKKQLVLNEKEYVDTINYLQTLPWNMSNNLLVQLMSLYQEQNPKEEEEAIIEDA